MPAHHPCTHQVALPSPYPPPLACPLNCPFTCRLLQATEDADTKLLLGQARVIDELEATIPRWVVDGCRE